MKGERNIFRSILGLIVLSFFIFPFSSSYAADSTKVEAKESKPKTSIYGGMTLKLDLGAAALTAALSNGKLQQYELAMNWRLKNRFYPTLELGYAGGRTSKGDSLQYNAHGGFVRVGCDVNPLKKHPESPHALLLGIRIGTGVQERGYTDCWGEIAAGCQVEIAKVGKTAFYMGWTGRLKILFTREKSGLTADQMKPIYIPGYGKRGDTRWGASYYLGWRF